MKHLFICHNAIKTQFNANVFHLVEKETEVILFGRSGVSEKPLQTWSAKSLRLEVCKENKSMCLKNEVNKKENK